MKRTTYSHNNQNEANKQMPLRCDVDLLSFSMGSGSTVLRLVYASVTGSATEVCPAGGVAVCCVIGTCFVVTLDVVVSVWSCDLVVKNELI